MSERPEIIPIERPELSPIERPSYSNVSTLGGFNPNQRPVVDKFERPPVPGVMLKPVPFNVNDSKAASSPSEPVKGERTASDLTIPTDANADHPDFEIKLNDQKTLKMRWDEDLGYVVIGEKNGSGEMKLYTQAEFAEANKGQLESSGGGRIPGETTKMPEFCVPPEGDKSLIYRYDSGTKTDVIVGYRVNGERHYFQSQATMDLVNAKAKEAGLSTPERPPAPAGKNIPKADDHNSGYIPDYELAKNGENGKTYIWRYDKTAGRYTAVGELKDPAKGVWHWYTKAEYMEKNSGPNALQKSGPEYKAPVADSRGEMELTGNEEFKIVGEDPPGYDGNGDEMWGTPIYVYDKNTGHKVFVGVRVSHDGKEIEKYFDASEMKKYNNYVQGEGGNSYWEAKPLTGNGSIDPDSQRINDGSQGSGHD